MNRKKIAALLSLGAALAMLDACSTSNTGKSPVIDRDEPVPTVRASENHRSSQKEAKRIDAPDYDEIRQRYNQNADDFNKLALQLELDLEVTELYCDENMVVVTTEDETFYDGENDPYTSKYTRLCRFNRNVGARSSAKGTIFPHRFFEVGSLMVYSYLEKRRNPSDTYNDCRVSLYEGERGTCAIAINEDWLAAYSWGPFCLDYMKGEVGC